MDLGAPPPDPYAGMTPQERKRAQESRILEMVYDTSKLFSVSPQERPDFALRHGPSSMPFGVEVTQLFVDESDARFNLVPGYAHRLWSGGAHLHKEDVQRLKSVTVEVTDKDGNVRYSDLPVVITEPPDSTAFRSGLAKAIRTKTARCYDSTAFSHLNLVILDWFHLRFDATDYRTEHFFDDAVRTALLDSPFHEVYLIAYNTVRPKGDESTEPLRPEARVIPLQQLLAIERFYVTGHLIDQAYEVSDLAELNRLIIDHVGRVQGCGVAVECDGRPFLRYRGALLEVSEDGIQVRDGADYQLPNYPLLAITDRLNPDVEDQVTESAGRHVFECGFTLPANQPTTD